MTILEFFEKLGFENPRFNLNNNMFYVMYYNKELALDYLIYRETDNGTYFVTFKSDKNDEKTLNEFIQKYKGKYLIYYSLDKKNNPVTNKIKIPDELELVFMSTDR